MSNSNYIYGVISIEQLKGVIMVIINCRYGFANQLYHFAAGYSLACARGDELFIDCSYSYNGSVMGYLVDELQIDDYKKIEYDFAQNEIGRASCRERV